MKQHLSNETNSTRLLTLHQVASRLQVDDTTVRRWIKNGVLPAVTLPTIPGAKRQSYRVLPETMENLINPVYATSDPGDFEEFAEKIF